ncbi:hypothetical protein [Streptomyces boninensis]|uniref:hypothetical protein n=1 Tax=Streptomyces boninensis TaxID=2039455 RepID=UPI003B227F1F
MPPVTPSRRTLLAGALAATAATTLAGRSAAAAPTGHPTDLGTPLKDVNLNGFVGTAPDNTPILYGANNGRPAALTSVDARTGAARWTSDLPGATAAGAFVQTAADTLFLGAGGGHLFRVDTGTGAVTDLGAALDGETEVQGLALGPDGKLLYGVTFPGAKLFSFDPADGAAKDLGALADDTGQGHAVAAHQGKLYAGTMVPAHFLEIDTATGEPREIPLPDEADPGNPQTSIFEITPVGDLLFVRAGDDVKYATLFPYDPATGTWKPGITDVAGLGVSPAGPDGEVYFMRKNKLTAYAPATGTLTETALTYPGRVYNFRGADWVELTDADWPGKTLTGFFWTGEPWRFNPQTGKAQLLDNVVPPTPVGILSLSPAADGGVWAGGKLAGFAHVDVHDGTADYHHWSQPESIVDDGKAVWLGAYPDSRLYRYDPDLPFNDPDYQPGPPGSAVNPRKLADFSGRPGKPQDRVHAMLRTGRRVLAATGPKRASFGGTLVISDLAGKDVRIYDNIPGDRALTSLAAARGVVFAGSWINGGTGTGSTKPPEAEGTVLALDPRSGDVLWQRSPLQGAPSYVATTVDARGRLWTLAGTTLLRLHPATGAVLRRVELPGKVDTKGMTWPWMAGQISRVPRADALYVKVAGRLHRVRGGDGKVTDLGEFPYGLFTVAADGRLVMCDEARLFSTPPPDRA